MIRCLDEANRFACPHGDLSVALLTSRAMGKLHARFLDDATPTDVITFEGDESAGLAGEICVCPDVARNYAAARNNDFSEELALYIVHGYLHLCGQDDVDPVLRRRMRAAERTAMKIIHDAKCTPQFSFA